MSDEFPEEKKEDGSRFTKRCKYHSFTINLKKILIKWKFGGASITKTPLQCNENN